MRRYDHRSAGSIRLGHRVVRIRRVRLWRVGHDDGGGRRRCACDGRVGCGVAVLVGWWWWCASCGGRDAGLVRAVCGCRCSSCSWRGRAGGACSPVSANVHRGDRSGVVLRIEVPRAVGLAVEQARDGDGGPLLVLADEGERVHERGHVAALDLVLEDDKARRAGAREPLCELRLDLLRRRAAAGKAPVGRVAVPDHRCEAEDFRRDGAHAVVGVAIRRPPVAGDTPAC